MCWVFPRQLIMAQNAKIGHFTVCKGLAALRMGEHASIGRLNWISAYPLSQDPNDHFASDVSRRPELILHAHAAVTNRHIIDCTDLVTVGRFATVAGFRSQVLTHSIDLLRARQSSAPVSFGEFSFVGTGVICLPGSALPDRSVLAAGSVMTSSLEHVGGLYAGVPAKFIKNVESDKGYFVREYGYVR